jgi:FkbM family methyltransferase
MENKNETDGFSAKIWLHAGLWCYRHLRGKYAAVESLAVAPLVGKTDICLDIGAHAGSWTLPLAKLVPQGRVYAFEALPYYARVLKRLCRLFGLNNVVVLNRAVSNEIGSVALAWRNNQGRRLTGNTHMATSAESAEMECVSVPAVTLDSWQQQLGPSERVSFIKIDVEGAERLVLRGAEALIRQCRPVIFMEIVTSCCERYGYGPADLFQLFTELDYDAYTVKVLDGQVALRPSNAQTYPGKGDVLLIPSGTVLPAAFKMEVPA